MQIDMHYYGTYVMARCAGLNENIARAIATAAEYVDDSDRLSVKLTDGEIITSEPTAHHPEDGMNLLPVDQRRTWIPFHFIPGNTGNDLANKLVCQTNSEIAREMVNRNITLAAEPIGVILMGITAHVYADTFSHYGFSGISSHVNHVRVGSIRLDDAHAGIEQTLSRKMREFVDIYIKGPFADAVSKLGHAGVATFPDQPYLRWGFTYDTNNKDSGWRDNQTTFLMACEELHKAFIRFGKMNDGGYVDSPEVDFDDIREVICKILAVKGETSVRIEAWQSAVKDGKLYPNSTCAPIPQYDPSTYITELAQLPNLNSEKAKRTLVYTFIQAANNHRDYVLNELLPKYGINVSDTLIEWVKEEAIP